MDENSMDMKTVEERVKHIEFGGMETLLLGGRMYDE